MSLTHLVRIEAAAARADISAKTLWRLLGDGLLTRYRQHGRTYVDAAEIDALMNERSVVTAERGITEKREIA